ncbi:PAAR domain-containing protein [Stenotrophomonas rhizophila]
MARLFIVVGDSLSSGGTVVSGSPFTDIDGSAMARVGDRVICKTHGPGSIVSGDATLIIDGNPAARHGDKVSCGCQLIAGRQSLAFVDGGQSSAAPQRRSTPTIPGTSDQPVRTQADASPSSAAPENAAICWLMDHVVEVSTNAHGRYYQAYDADGDEHDYEMHRAFRISIPLLSRTDVEVLVRVKIVAGAPTETDAIVEEDIRLAKERMEEGVRDHWNGKYTLAVWDPRCGQRTFAIKYAIEWVEQGQHYTLKLNPSNTRENVDEMVINAWKGTSAWTMAHEYAHCVGVPDEYSYDLGRAESLRYYRHDGTPDDDVVSMPLVKPASDPTANIMSTSDNRITELRHAWPIAIEAQEFLTTAIGRRIKCTVT